VDGVGELLAAKVPTRQAAVSQGQTVGLGADPAGVLGFDPQGQLVA
jgi:hypothetical protein